MSGNRKLLYFNNESVLKRARFLRAIKRFREQGKQIIFIDESWLDNADYTGRVWVDTSTTGAEITNPGTPFVPGLMQAKSLWQF